MSHDEKSPPPLGEGEYFHFEYLFFDPEDAETGFSNMVELARVPTGAQELAYKLLGDPHVWAIHIRRYEQPEQGVHLYDETQPLAKAQNEAYAERQRADALQKLLNAARESGRKLETESRRVERHDAITIEALNAVIETLAGMLETIRQKGQHDQRGVVYEPSDIYRMTTVNLRALRESEVRKVRTKSRAHHFEVSFDEVVTAYEELDEKKYRMETECERQLQALEIRIEAKDAVIEYLADMLAEIKRQAVRDQQDAVMMEPGEVARLAKVNIQALQDNKLRKARGRVRQTDEPGVMRARLMVPSTDLTAPAVADPVLSGPDDDMDVPEDLCVCAHERNRHFDGSCHDCARDEYDHEFKLAVL